MKATYTCLLIVILLAPISAQPNCNLYKENPDCYAACTEIYKALRYKQGSSKSQAHFDKSIELCQDIAYSYQQKAIPFLKRGNFVEWKRLIDKAVKLDSEQYLGYRGWCRLQFLRDYDGAIADIERLKQITEWDIGYCQTGDYHLDFALALCYKKIGKIDTARNLMLNKMETEIDAYDFYHLGVLEFEQSNFELAHKYFLNQIEVNDSMAETYYFIALCEKRFGNIEEYELKLDKAEQYYRKGKVRTDTYTETIDKIYLNDIQKEKTDANICYE